MLSHGEIRAAARTGHAIAANPDADDRFGRLALSKNGLRQRDRVVLATLRHSGIPTAVMMAGGYARRIENTVDIHFATVATAATFGR